MRTATTIAFTVVCWCAWSPTVAGQTDPSVSNIRAALESPQAIINLPVWTEPTPTRLGMLTLLPPQTPGEVVRVSVPIGEITTRAIRAIGDAQRRRTERKAREEVLGVLRAIEAQAAR